MEGVVTSLDLVRFRLVKGQPAGRDWIEFLGWVALGSGVIFNRRPATMQRVLGIVALVVGLGTFGEAAGAETKVDALRVSISVFSGRPDPVFLITDPKLIGEVITMATSFPIDKAFPGESVIPSILGYRGVVIDNVSTIEPDVQEILVNGMNVELHRSTATKGLTKEFRLDRCYPGKAVI